MLCVLHIMCAGCDGIVYPKEQLLSKLEPGQLPRGIDRTHREVSH